MIEVTNDVVTCQKMHCEMVMLDVLLRATAHDSSADRGMNTHMSV